MTRGLYRVLLALLICEGMLEAQAAAPGELVIAGVVADTLTTAPLVAGVGEAVRRTWIILLLSLDW